MTGPATARPQLDPDLPVVGIDIGKKCWVAAGIDEKITWIEEFPSLGDLLDDIPDGTVVGIDVPVQLEDGWRECDAAAKRLLGTRHSTIFSVPPRAVFLEPESAAEANELAKKLTGRGLSTQAFYLRRHVQEVLAQSDRARFFEIHPELSFAAMAGEPIAQPKTTWNGQMRRRRLLREQGLRIPDRLPRVSRSTPDDILDAVAVAWSARRIARGIAERIPADGAGAAIWR